MEFIAGMIIAACVFAAFHQKIRTDILLLHIMFLACVPAACYIYAARLENYIDPWLMVWSMGLAGIAIIYWGAKEFHCMIRQEG